MGHFQSIMGYFEGPIIMGYLPFQELALGRTLKSDPRPCKGICGKFT